MISSSGRGRRVRPAAPAAPVSVAEAVVTHSATDTGSRGAERAA